MESPRRTEKKKLKISLLGIAKKKQIIFAIANKEIQCPRIFCPMS